ncbi:hypothetical protein J1N09_13255 [Aureitalea sp. L0-47]|uniref:hypothetical protein n=1 Tax=Aureitalea sp. L0-47 TaxID=2816962 RepID=UPI002237FD44|nr:hypothetical protein [Aureitalea sp. L0-47]MCW5520809.1 hypothetical protein [Aureitalea sp. L0-47]
MLPSEKHRITFDFGVAELHQNYMLMVMNEGITVDSAINTRLTDMAAEHFGDKPFGYITHRKNSYSVDPNVYHETSKIKNLVGFAIVSDKEIHLTTSQVESMFLNKPMKVFKEVDAAVEWVYSLLSSN